MADLTPERKAAVQESWELVRKNMRTHALNFFLFFFKRHPEYQKLFKDFKDVPANELPEQAKFRGHAVRVFFAITSLVDNLDDLDIVVDILQKTTKDHVPRGITSSHYENLLTTILAFLSETLKESFTDRTRDGWEVTAKVILSVVNAQLAQIQKC